MNVNFEPQPIMVAADNYFCAQIHYLLSDLANSYVSEGIDEFPGMEMIPAILLSTMGTCRLYALDEKICEILKVNSAQLIVRSDLKDDDTAFLDLPYIVDKNLNTCLNGRPSENLRQALVELVQYIKPRR
jgi:hypothetical protein